MVHKSTRTDTFARERGRIKETGEALRRGRQREGGGRRVGYLRQLALIASNVAAGSFEFPGV